ncbi:MAG: DNA polymerase III subunit delta' [Gammaproteobacteria bacterium]|nr:DNA polymerase III subunit delta' [Gammaproteobacteria bacterium]
MAVDTALTAPAARYPWHDALWANLAHPFDRLPHALLLHGLPGLGKNAFALQLAQVLLCQTPQVNNACGKCHSCQLFAAATHPDLLIITPLEDAKNISVDQIRALNGFVFLRPHTAPRKIVVIQPAETMNINAANSLLKLLEEPPLDSILLLVTSRPARLPATIRSRCGRLQVKPPNQQMALAWLQANAAGTDAVQDLLQFAGGAPLLAKTLAEQGFAEQRQQLRQDLENLSAGREDPVICALRWKNLGTNLCLSWLYRAVLDLIKSQAGVASGSSLDSDTLKKIYKNTLNISVLYKYIYVIHDYYRQLNSPLDELLMLEDILIRWNRISRLQ